MRLGKSVKLRKMPAMDAISEAVGRAAEMGAPIYYTLGSAGGTLSNAEQGPQTLASINIMGYAARMCAKSGVRLDVYSQIPDALPLIQETMQDSYTAEGKADEYLPEQVTFINETAPYLTASLGYMQREKPASTMLIGGFYYESIVLGEAGNTIGALQIGGTANTHQMPFLAATCDYMLLSEELYAAAASISNDAKTLGTLRGEDVMKLAFVAVLLIGLALGATRIDWLVKLLKM